MAAVQTSIYLGSQLGFESVVFGFGASNWRRWLGGEFVGEAFCCSFVVLAALSAGKFVDIASKSPGLYLGALT